MAIESFAAANIAILGAYADIKTALPDNEKFDGVVGSPVMPERVSQFLEFAYANKDALPPAVKEAAADVGSFATANGFYGLAEDQRGFKMVQVLRGEAVTDAPEPKADYMPAEAPAEDPAVWPAASDPAA